MSKLIYVASAYSDPDKNRVQLRMNKFSSVMAALIENRIHPVSPLLNHYMDGIVKINFPLTWDWWEEYSRLLLSRCDHMVVIVGPGWENSTGVKGEMDLAKELNIPITFVDNHQDVLDFIKSYKESEQSNG